MTDKDAGAAAPQPTTGRDSHLPAGNDRPAGNDWPAGDWFAGDWFVALPDGPTSFAPKDPTGSCLPHPSGRPWLIGRWSARDLRVGTAGEVSLAAIGLCAADDQTLTALAERIRHPSDVTRVTEHLRGSFHLLASVRGVTVVRGSLSGLRRVYRATIDGTVLACDRADVLAAIAGTGLDEVQLAMRLLVLTDTLPLRDETGPLWRGVSAVPTAHSLWISGEGSGREHRYWTPPPADLSLAEGADRLRETLTAAVRTRTDLGRELSADLSGGLDSTSVCWLLKQSGREFRTFSTDTGDPRDDDPWWAALAAEQLQPAHRIVAAVTDLPMHYADLLDELPPLDEPFPGVGDRAEYRAVTGRLLDVGSELHLTGDGGDEVVTATEGYLPEVLRRRPLRALAHLRAYRAHNRWSPRTTLRALRPPSGRSLLLANAATLAARLPATRELPRDEESVVRAYLPPWATPDTVAAVRDRLRELAGELPPESGGRAQSEAVRGIAYSGHLTRGISQFTALLGLPVTAPFLDDQVIDACLGVRPDERADPWRYKPLLTAAMRGVVPDRSLRRTSKADGASLALRSIRTHRDKLLALCDDSALARLGLVDAAALRRTCSTSLWPSDLTPIALSPTFSCERWLRDLSRRPAPTPASDGAAR